jgi:predicted XRE-type DNA-binding protein
LDFQTWNPNTQCVWEQAAAAMGLPQPQLSDLLRGRFRGISETRMLDGLARLSSDVEIAVAPRRDATAGRIVVFFPEAR